jgi:hypothetical protein
MTSRNPAWGRPLAWCGVLLFIAILVAPPAAACAAAAGRIVGWGYNGNGQSSPPAGSNYTAIAAGEAHALALRADGSIVAWGRNTSGQATPPAGTGFTAIAAGDNHSLALRADGSIVAWGNNDWGQASPPAGRGYTAIAAGSGHSVALRADGSIVVWGANGAGQLSPPPGTGYTSIVADYDHSLALKADGSIVGWGNNGNGQSTPPGGSGYTAIAAGGFHSLAIKPDGSIVHWGSSYSGEAPPPAGGNYIAIAAHTYRSLALKRDGSIVGWGDDSSGVAPPPAGTGYSAIAAGYQFALALEPQGAAPPAPTLTTTSPRSPGNATTVFVKGSAQTGSTVRLYTTATCTGTPAAQGSADAFGSSGLSVSVPANSTTTFRATATAPTGNISECSSSSLTYLEDFVAPPAPLLAGPTQVTQGTTASFTAAVTDSGLAGLDADGVVWRARGGLPEQRGPTAAYAFPAAGLYTIDVTATDRAGNTSPQASLTITVTATSTRPDTDGDGIADDADRCPGTPAGNPDADHDGCPDADGPPNATDRCPTRSGRADGQPIGVSIEAAARYTNSPNVELTIRPPDTTSGLYVSNDGGFTRPFTVPLHTSLRYSWTLDSSGPERLPKTVYVRFAGGCAHAAQTFTDDIILDETPPTLATPTVLAPAKGRRGPLSLNLKAADNASGVSSVEVRRKKARIFAAKYQRQLRLEGSPDELTVRVRDGAGNTSPWKKVKVVRKRRTR